VGLGFQRDQSVVTRPAGDARVGERLEETVAMLVIQTQRRAVEPVGENARGEGRSDSKAGWQARQDGVRLDDDVRR
jgi:hypothetical protein